MTTIASFIGGGPLEGQQRVLDKEAPDFIRSLEALPAGTPTPDVPSTWPHYANHVYELDAVRLVFGGEAHVFYHYIGTSTEGELI